jgi:hypothetical protein
MLRLKEKLKLTEKRKNLLFRKLLHFPVFQSAGHRPISVADLG